MKFKQPRIVTHTDAGVGVDANGNPTTTAVITQPLVEDVILGDGSSTFQVLQPKVDPLNASETPVFETVASTALPFTIAQKANGTNRVFVHVHVVDLGALTSLDTLIEFQDPDRPDRWIPSLEGVARTVGTTAGHTLNIAAAGSYLVASREEHLQFDNFRVTFSAGAGAADGDTRIEVSWFHAGKKATVPEQ